MRAFVALPAPEPWIAPLVRAQGLVAGGRRVPAEDLHLTLAFLDEQDEARIEALHAELDARALPQARLRPLAWTLIEAGQSRIVALEVAPDAGLAALREAVRAACRAAGIALSRERFRPHVTIARHTSVRDDAAGLPQAIERLGAPAMDAAASGAVTLWSSRLTPDGALYEALSSYPLRAA